MSLIDKLRSSGSNLIDSLRQIDYRAGNPNYTPAVGPEKRQAIEQTLQGAKGVAKGIIDSPVLNPGAYFVEPGLKKLGVPAGIAGFAGLAADIAAPGPGELRKVGDLASQALKPGKVAGALDNLVQEARKYKSAEEFVNSVIYHGTSEHNAGKIDKYGFRVPTANGKEVSPGVSFSWDFDTALSYADEIDGKYRDSDVFAVIPRKGAKNIGTDGVDKLTGEDIYRPEDFVVIGRGRQSTAQLTDIWNKANKSSPSIKVRRPR